MVPRKTYQQPARSKMLGTDQLGHEYTLVRRATGPFPWPKSRICGQENLLLVGSYDEMIRQAVIAGLHICQSGSFRHILQKVEGENGYNSFKHIGVVHEKNLGKFLSSMKIEISLTPEVE